MKFIGSTWHRPRCGLSALVAVLLAGGGCFEALASEVPEATPQSSRQWTVSVRWENDFFASRDRWYTDGVSLSLAHTGPSWLDPLAA